MYKNAGREIKDWVQIFVVIATLPSLLLGILFMIALAQQDALIFGIMIAVIVTAIGYWIARFSGLIVYAYGEIADRILQIDERLASQSAKAEQENSEENQMSKEDDVQQPVSEKWACEVCGQTNSSKSKWCARCNAARPKE